MIIFYYLNKISCIFVFDYISTYIYSPLHSFTPLTVGSGHSWITDGLANPGGRSRRGLPPDLSVYCDACSIHVTLVSLPRHRLYHRCLARLGYGCFGSDGELQPDWQPERLDELLDRRRELLSRLTEEATNDKSVHALKWRSLHF